jgi:hypothetical protein
MDSTGVLTSDLPALFLRNGNKQILRALSTGQNGLVLEDVDNSKCLLKFRFQRDV